MSTQVVMSFALSAVLGNGFRSAFNNAGKMMEGLGKQISALEKNQGQISAFQKMQGTLAQGAEKLNAARMKVKSLGQEMKASSVPSAALKQAFSNANIEAHRLETRLASQRKELGSLRTQLKEAGIDTKNLGSEQARLADQSGKVAAAQKKLSDAQAAYNAAKQRTSWENIKGDLAASAAGVMALKVPVGIAMNFEQAMSGVEAVKFGGKAGTEEQRAELAALKEQALELGSTTQFTAIQAAQSQENLARAGFTSSQILKAMPGLLDMAAAEGMDLSSAASIAANALRGFNMDASESRRVADVLAETSAMTNTSISGLGEAMKYVAPMAAGLNVPIEETAALLGAMANAGIDASMSGTALRAAFTRLSKEPKAAAKALAALGVASRSANGDMRRLPIIMEDLSKKTAKMGDADRMKHLTNIFGTEAASGMLAIMKAVEKGDLANFEEALMGGKAFRAASAKLAEKPKEIEKALSKLGIASRTAKGEMRALPSIMNEFAKKTSKMGEADKLKHLTKIFGKDAASGLLGIMKEVEKGNFSNFEEAFKKESDGVARAMAKARTDNFAGDLTALSSAWEGLNVTIGSAFTPLLRDATKLLTGLIGGVNALAQKFPTITKYAVRFAGMFVLKKTILTGFRIGKDLLSLPILASRVAKASLEASAATGQLTLTQKAAYAFMKGKQWLWNTAKLAAYKVKTLAVAAATKVWAAAQWVWRGAMKACHALWGVTKLVVYKAQTLAVAAATKAWAAAQWLWNAAMSANPIGAVIVGVAALIGAGYALYKNWDRIKQFGAEMWDYIQKKAQVFADWWDSWTLKDVFAPLMEWFDNAINYIKGQWNKFCDWIASFNPFSSWSVPDTPEMKVKVEAMGRQGAVNDKALDMAFGAPQGIGHNALGGVIEHPMISWLAESGPEAVVPLTDKSRGVPLLMEAGRRLGMPDNAWNMIVEAPDIGQKLNIAAHATGGIFSSPHIGLVAEAGPEAIVPLSDRSRGIPLWLAAGEEMGVNFRGGNTVDNSYTGGPSNSSSYVGGSPTINITVNGGGGDDRGLAQRIAQAVRDVMSDMQSYEERVAFA